MNEPLCDESTLASRRAACDLLGIEAAKLDALILQGKVRTERIRGREFVQLAEVERATAGEARQ